MTEPAGATTFVVGKIRWVGGWVSAIEAIDQALRYFSGGRTAILR